MPTRSPRDTAKRCLFGGTLLAAGLATPGAHAQSFDFVESTATADTTGSRTDSFSGPGPWHVESHYSYFGYGDAEAWGMSNSLGLYAYGKGDTGELTANADVDSRFTVTSDVSVTLDHYLYFGDSSLILTDLTNDVILFSWNGEFKGTQQLQLAADTLYEYSSSTNNGSSSLTIRCAADLDASGDVGFSDLLAVLSTWGESGVLEDLDGSGMVDFADLLIVLANWGPCK